ncbi:MAG: NAD-dependent epimerase/dehydratase family protein [Candidatus Sericytochromatia bacterium]
MDESPRFPLTVITGAGGYLGSQLAHHLLAQGQRVRALLHSEPSEALQHRLQGAEIVLGSVTHAPLMRELLAEATQVYHLAACTQAASHAEYIETNVTGTLNVLHAALASDARMVYLSSHEVYGRPLYSPLDEQHPLLGQSAHAASRIAADMLAESFGRSFGLWITVVRLFPVMGWDQPQGLLSALAAAQLQNHHADWQHTALDLLTLPDFLDALPRIAATPALRGQVVNLGSGQLTPLRELHELVANTPAAPDPADIETWLRRDGRLGNLAKLRRLLNWEPSNRLTDCLKAV